MSGPGSRVRSGVTAVRAQSNVIAVVLLAGLVISGATVVVITGSVAISQNQEDASYTSGKQSIQSLGERIDRVSSSGDSLQANMPDFPEGSSQLDTSVGEMTVSVSNGGSTDSESRTLGAVTYEQDGRSVAYQGGGVFEGTSTGGSSVVSPPPVSYRYTNGKPTLTIPMVLVRGDSVDSGVELERQSVSNLLATMDGNPSTAANDDVSPLPSGSELTISVTSPYYEGWGQAFENRVGVPVNYDHDAQTASFSLQWRDISPPTPPTPTPSPTATPPATPPSTPTPSPSPTPTSTSPGGGSSGSQVTMVDASVLGEASLAANNRIEMDSYNSNVGPYGGNNVNDRGDVRIHGRVTMKNRIHVSGELHAERLEIKQSGGTVEGKTVIGGDPTDSTVPTSQGGSGDPLEFGGVFSLNDDFDSASVGKEFASDVIIGGELISFGHATVDGTLHVHESASFSGWSDTTIQGNLIVDGDVELTDEVTVDGDVVASGEVTGESQATVRGNGQLTSGGNGIAENVNVGDVIRSPLVPQLPSVPTADDEIDTRAQQYANDNDNEQSAFIHSGDPNCKKGPCLVTAGDYYANSITVQGKQSKLVLDTSGGDINIYLDEAFIMKSKSPTVVVKGNNRVNFYIDSGGNKADFRMVNSAQFITGSEVAPTDNGTKAWVYMKSDGEVKMNNKIKFTGVIYGPGEQPGEGVEFRGTNRAKFFGAVIGDPSHAVNRIDFHYDEAIAGESTTIEGGSGGTSTPTPSPTATPTPSPVPTATPTATPTTPTPTPTATPTATPTVSAPGRVVYIRIMVREIKVE